MSEDISIAGDSAASDSIHGDDLLAQGPHRRPRLPGLPSLRARVFLVVASVAGFWHRESQEMAGQLEGGPLCLGAVLVSSHIVAEAGGSGSDADDRHQQQITMRSWASRLLDRRSVASGWVEYRVEESAYFHTPVPFEEAHAQGWLRSLGDIAVQPVRQFGTDSQQAPYTLKDIVQRWQRTGAMLADVAITIGAGLAARAVAGRWSPIHAVAITRRINRKRLLVKGVPSATMLKRFLHRWGVSVPVPAAGCRLEAYSLERG